MLFRKALLLLCLGASTASLAAGYCLLGRWLGGAFVILPGVALLFHKKLPGPVLPSAYLLAIVCFAAAGLFVGAPAFLMILGAALALASWDLANLDGSMNGSTSGQAAVRFERKHARCLALAIGFGLLLAGGGIMLALRIPFAVMLLLAILGLFSMDCILRYLRKREQAQ